MTASTAESPLPSRLPPGAVIAQRYRIDSVLAEGGMGIVYRGWHLTLCQPIAIKVVRPELLSNAEAVSRFLNEARAVASLRAVNVAQVLDVGRIRGDTLYMVMEYLDGRDLRATLDEDGALPLGRAADYLVQACTAMQEVHALGIVHRDLKPENLFVANLPDGRQVLKIIDFGISKRLDDTGRSFTQPDRSLGSPQYMAPEQVSTPDHVDSRADIWSFGVVLFEMLTNSVPFRAHSITATCARVLCGEPNSLRQLRPELPEEIYAILQCCLAKNPADRFQTMEELAEALRPFATSTQLRQSRPSFRLVLNSDVDVPREERPSERTPAPAVGSAMSRTPVPATRRFWPTAGAFALAAAATVITLNWPRFEQSSPAFAAATESGTAAVGEAYKDVGAFVKSASSRVAHPCVSLNTNSGSDGKRQDDAGAPSGRVGAFVHSQLTAVCERHLTD
jgi:serine/threonine protein kinase